MNETTETWYEAYSWGLIQPVEIRGHTEKRVTLANGRLQYKDSDGVFLRPTWEEARRAIVEYQEGRIAEAKRNLDRMRSELQKLQALEAPK